MALSVRIQKTVVAPLPPAWLRRVLQEAAREPDVAAALVRITQRPPEVTVRIVGGRAIRRLHRDFFDDPEETDVLSFPSGSADQDGYLGDIALCWPAVVRQAAQYGHAPEAEAALLSVHGLLHLLDWDHRTPEEEKEMTSRTLSALAGSGVQPATARLPEP